MSDKVNIGKLITGEAGRDAIHIAIAPVVANEKLVPGQRIGFVGDSRERVEAKIGAARKEEVIGIVDPFIPTLVEPEERFYMFLLPNSILSLRHHWTHPAFPNEPVTMRTDEELAELWLRNYALTVALRYDSEHGADYCYRKFMETVRDGSIFYYGNDCHSASEVEDARQLYRNLSIVLGREVGPDDFEFSCSC